MRDAALFRAEAKAALSEPERLAASLRLVEPRLLMATLALAFLVVAAFATAALVRVPVFVTGGGVFLSSKGVLEFTVSSEYDGRVVAVLVDVGQTVVKGQEIARVVQPALENELRLAESEFDLTSRELEAVRALQVKVSVLQDDLRRQQGENNDLSVRLLSERLGHLEKLDESQVALMSRGNTTMDRYLHVRADLADTRERLAAKQGEVLALRLEANERRAQYEREILALEARVAQAGRQVERLRGRIANETVVRSPENGIVSELKIFPGDLIRFDTPIVGLLPVDDSFSDFRPGAARLMAAVLVPAKDGKKVRPGMNVLIDPTSVRRDVYGAVMGTVTRASEVASSPEQLRHMLRNDDLVRKFTEEGPPFLVMVEPLSDTSAKTGFRWSTSKGPDTAITVGTMLDAKIGVERVSVLSLLLPATKALFGVDG